MKQILIELEAHLKTKKGQTVLQKLKKQVDKDEKYSQKMYNYLSLTLDGVKPEVAAKECELL